MKDDMDAATIETHLLDGRTARRHRNKAAVLDAVIALFGEDNLSPGVHQVAQRSGVSLRSVYRYFADADDLIAAAITRHLERSSRLFDMPEVGVGSTSERIHRFCNCRMSFFSSVRCAYRANAVRACRHRQLAEDLDASRQRLRHQTEQMFRPELAALGPSRAGVVASVLDTLSQLDTLEYQYRNRSFDEARTTEFLIGAFTEVLCPGTATRTGS